MFNVRTIVRKIIGTGAISIVIEYVGQALASYFIIPDEASTLNDVPLVEGHLVFVNQGNMPAEFYIDDNGNLKVVTDELETTKYSVDGNGHLIYTT